MPTSSQALILNYNHIDGTLVSSHKRSSLCLNKEPAPFTIAAVYNLSGFVPLSTTNVNDHQAVQALGRESAQLFKYHKFPKGYKSILSFDQPSQAFQLQVLGGTLGSRDLVSSESFHTKPSTQTDDANGHNDKQTERPCSASVRRKESTPCFVDEDLYDRLIGLGFRKSALSIKPGSDREHHTKTRLHHKPYITSHHANIVTRPKSNRYFEHAVNQTIVTNQEETKDDCTVSCDKAEVETESSETDGQLVEDDTETRILPTIYMRKDVPTERPTTVIFSFRDNEFSSHAEVKYLMETQVGVRVKSVQFDPLDVRVCKPGIRSRWFVELFTPADTETAVQKGLSLGKDKIIIFKYDNIAKREHSSFKYFMTIQEAKRKLRGSKSVNIKAKKSKENNIIKIRGTKSEKNCKIGNL